MSEEQARAQIHAALMQEKFEQEYERFLERLRKQTYVERKGAFADAAGQMGAAAGGEPPRLQ
jgi:hypothetical protein